jgi:transcriptional regulator with XRE-family HTH domain
MKNRIKRLREKAGLSQRQLAAAAGTSQAQLQRIEAGVQEARLELAVRLSHALAQPLDQVFPGAMKTLSAIREKNQDLFDVLHRGEAHVSSELENAGLDVDAELWYLKYRLRGGQHGVLPISGPEKHRLWDVLQHEPKDLGFVVFDSGSKQIAINSKHLLFWHFLFDPNWGQRDRDEDDSEPRFEGAGNLNFFLADGTRLGFDVDHDTEKYSVEAENDDQCQFQMLMLDLDGLGEDQEVINFMDVDGETAFIRTSEIALVEIKLSVVEPDIDADDDSEAEEENQVLSEVPQPTSKNFVQ